MSLNVMMGPASPPVAKGAERAREAPADALRFDDALAGNADRRKQPFPATATRAGDRDRDDPPSRWMRDGYGGRFAFALDAREPAPDTEAPDDVPERAGDAEPDFDLAEDAPAFAAKEDEQIPAIAPAVPNVTDTPYRRGTGKQDAAARQEPRGEPAATRIMPARQADPVARAATDAVSAKPEPEQAPSPPSPRAFEGSSPQREPQRAPTGEQTAPRATLSSANAATPPERAAPAANDPLAGRVSVLGVTGAIAPAPPQPPLGATAAGLVAAIEGDGSWRQAAAETPPPALRHGPSQPLGVSSLRIQLNPAELGMVTARLTASGTQLSIEIQVETSDARQKLAADGEAILKALRSIGYDVEKVTIQQAPQGGGQANAQASAGSGREPFQARDETGERGQGGRDTAGREQDGNGHERKEAAERRGGGVYI